MQAHLRLLSAAVGAAALIAAPTAQAAATASASLSNITLTVVDLDLNDGVTAGFTVFGTYSFSQAIAIGSDAIIDRGADNGHSLGGSPYVAVDPAFAMATGASASASLTGAEASASASALGGDQVAEGSVYAVTNSPRVGLSLQLTANTRLVFSADAAVAGSVDYSCGVTLCDASVSFLQLTGSGRTDSGNSIGGTNSAGVMNSFERLRLALGTEFGSTDRTQAVSRAMSLTFDNTYSGNASFQLAVEASALARSGLPVVAAPIPEPSTYALMLAGLGAVGFIARRRRGGAAA